MSAPELVADGDRLRQVIWNLLSNAIRPPRRADEYVISARCIRTRGDIQFKTLESGN